MSLSTPIRTGLPCARTGVAINPAIAASAAAAVNALNDIRPSIAPSDSEVVVQLVRLGLDAVIRDHVDDPAVGDDIMPLGHSGGKPEVLLDQQDGEALGLQRLDHRADLMHD